MSKITAEVMTGLDNKSEEKRKKAWSKYFETKSEELENVNTELIYGVQAKVGGGYVRVGYQKLREFYDGDQWQFVPEGGQPMRVYNFVRNVVNNYTAFMVNEEMDIDVPAEDITDEVEVARAEAKEELLKEVLEKTDFYDKFEMSVQNGSLLGDSILLGPFYNEENDEVEIKHVKKPENVKIIWADDQYKEIFGFIYTRYVSEEKAYEMFPELKEKGETFKTVKIATDQTGSLSNKTGRGGGTSGVKYELVERVRIDDCWTANVNIKKIGGKVVDFNEHNWDFVPILYVPNITHPTSPFGTSDIEDLLDSQVEYNERNSEMGEIISESAFPWIFGKNLQPVEVQSGRMNLIDVGDDAEIVPDPRRGNPSYLDREIDRNLSNLFQLSGLNENIFGGQNVKAVTGRALSVLMQSINNRIKGRQRRWTSALKKMFSNIFKLVEIYADNGKELVNEYYKTDIFFPGTLLRNITDEINKFNAKLQSQETTMKNLGVPSPKDEKKLIKEELKDKMLMAEISRNPELQMQINQMMQQEVANQISGTNNPMMREDENMEESPMAQGGAPQQSAVSPQGAVNQTNQRGGTSVAQEPREE